MFRLILKGCFYKGGAEVEFWPKTGLVSDLFLKGFLYILSFSEISFGFQFGTKLRFLRRNFFIFRILNFWQKDIIFFSDSFPYLRGILRFDFFWFQLIYKGFLFQIEANSYFGGGWWMVDGVQLFGSSSILIIICYMHRRFGFFWRGSSPSPPKPRGF